VTEKGATRQIAKVYYGELAQNTKPPKGAFRYLANKVREVCERELRGPQDVMDYIQRVAKHCADQGRFLEWPSPSGFPVSNRYQVPNMVTVTCLRGSVRVAEHDIADGVTDEIDHDGVKFAAAPNFVHSLDAAHLVKTVNAAVSEGITDLLTVHDCFYCLAPQATRLQKIILAELTNLYLNNPLAELRKCAPDIPAPDKGVLLTGHVTSGYDRDGPINPTHPLSLLKLADFAFDA